MGQITAIDTDMLYQVRPARGASTERSLWCRHKGNETPFMDSSLDIY
jgi:hypothetical protein